MWVFFDRFFEVLISNGMMGMFFDSFIVKGVFFQVLYLVVNWLKYVVFYILFIWGSLFEGMVVWIVE